MSIILVCPAIALNTLLLPTVVPNAVHDGSIIVVRLVQPRKQSFPAVVNDEKSGLVRLVQPSKQSFPAPTIHLALSSTFTRFVSF